MADGADNSRSSITITVKTPKEKHDITISSTSSVRELKEEVARQFGSPLDQLCLIFAGKILKDPDTLDQHSIKHGLTVHLVIKTTSRPAEPVAAAPSQPSGPSQPDVSQSPFGMGSMGGLPGISSMGMGSANFMEMQQRMQRELMGNPEMLRQMMDNPFVQNMMSNPDLMRQLILNNPQMRDLMERNPEITHMLNNPELMSQTMELARNPSMLQELMRSQDRAMSNLESLPGGFNALQRMYRDVQEPMMNAAQESLGSNPFSSLVGSGSGGGSLQQGRENSDPLPNPWAANSGSGGTTSSSSSTPSLSHGLLGTQGSMFNSPGMQSMMQQMMQNPQMIQNMMQAPYMQSMMQALATNPDLAQQVLSNNPLFAGNPQLMEQFRANLPTMMAQMNNPDVQSAMSNPRALDAIQQIQQAMQTLQSEAPTLFPGMTGMGSLPGATTTSTTPSTTTTTSTGTANTTTTGSATTTPPSGTGPAAGNQEAFTNMVSQLMGMMAGGQMNQTQPPEQRYASQLEQMATMGFVDRDANIRALTATLGDVNAAIDRLLQQR